MKMKSLLYTSSIYLITIVKCCICIFNNNNNINSSLAASTLLTTISNLNTKYSRSGGYPKFPLAEIHQVADNNRRKCGTRIVKFQPLRAGKIIGGSETPYGAFPWQVEIQLFNSEKYKFEHYCGGAVIASESVLTAAHCMQFIQNHQVRLKLGDHSLAKRDLYEHSYRVEKIVIHPQFRQNGPYSNDIAIIKVRSTNSAGIRFNTHVSPICLPHKNELPVTGTLCTVSGWGIQKVENLNSLSTILQAAEVPILDPNVCRRSSINGDRQQQILDSMLCAGRLDGGVDSCAGDSGGPLACEYQNKFILTGIVSWGDGCAKKNRPGVYTRVDLFTNWIDETLKLLES